jgi:hypothetical protein
MNHRLTLTHEELGLILDALDSHSYWQLSDQQYRNSGYVMDEGSDDPENAEAIKDVATLEKKLGQVYRSEQERAER